MFKESPEFVPRFDHFMGDNFTNLRQFAIQSKMPYVTTVVLPFVFIVF